MHGDTSREEERLVCFIVECTCALLVWCSPFTFPIYIGAESPGKVLVHHAADVALIVGEEDTA